MFHRLPTRPQLLISVRNATEAMAVAGIADIIDVKEPENGPLGAAQPSVWDEVLGSVSGTPVTLALGCVRDWDNTETPPIPENVAAVKLALDSASWSEWEAVRGQFENVATRPLAWVMVHDADGTRSVDESVERAVEGRCVAFLVDTTNKRGPRLRELWSTEEIVRVQRLTQRAGLPLALAGRLREGDLADLAEDADVVGVRSAACVRGERTETISQSAARRCRDVLTSLEEDGSLKVESR